MIRLFKLQFLGPLALFAATLAAELAAIALSYLPSSEWLWFVNLRLFGIFQRSHASLSDVIPLEGFQLYGVALPIFALACWGLLAKSRLPLAASTHLSAGYAAFMVLSWQTPHLPSQNQASLVSLSVPSGAGLYVLAAILGTCIVSTAVSHIVYLRLVREEI